MLLNLFKSRQPDIDDDTLEAANIALQGRMETMLERETLRRMRFATIQNTPVALR